MRSSLIAFGLISVGAATYAQPDTAPKTELRISLAPAGAYVSVPRVFAVSLTNATGHALRLPSPAVNCGAVPAGSVYLRLTFTPSLHDDAITLGRGCVEDFVRPKASIVDQAAKWIELLPGQATTVIAPLDGAAVLPTQLKPGRYLVSAEYEVPYVSASDREILKDREIAVPQCQAKSASLTFVLPQSAQDKR